MQDDLGLRNRLISICV